MKKHSHWRKIRRAIRVSDRRDKIKTRNLNSSLYDRDLNNIRHAHGSFVLVNKVSGSPPWDNSQLFVVYYSTSVSLSLMALHETPHPCALSPHDSSGCLVVDIDRFVTATEAAKILDGRHDFTRY